MLLALLMALMALLLGVALVRRWVRKYNPAPLVTASCAFSVVSFAITKFFLVLLMAALPPVMIFLFILLIVTLGGFMFFVIEQLLAQFKRDKEFNAYLRKRIDEQRIEFWR